MALSAKAGREGFAWFFGTVEGRDDPKQIGRVQVRIYDIHPPDKSLVKTEDLPWAYVIMPPFSAGSNQIGLSPTGMIVGTTVFGFFADANERQMPIVLGTLASIPQGLMEKHDVPIQARGSNDIAGAAIGPEPASSFAAQYPYNKVIKTEGGHVIELDDTPGHERIHMYHKSGTYTEINSAGQKVEKVANNNYHIVAGNEEVYINGNVNVRVTGDVNIVVDGNYSLNVTGDVIINGSTINLNKGTMGAARIGDVADTGDALSSVGSNLIETGSSTVIIGD